MAPESIKTMDTAFSPAAPAVEQAARILICLGRTRGRGMGLTSICREIGIHKSKGFSILNALARHDLVLKDFESKTYSLGPALIPLAQAARDRFDLTAVSRDHLQNLADRTQTCVLLGILSNDQVYIAGKYDGDERVSVTVNLSQSLHITHGSHGKALFSFLDKKEQKRLLSGGPVFFHGPPEKFDPARLKKELSFCRKNGYALDRAEMSPGINAVSAPIFNHSNTVIAAIVVLGPFPETRFPEFGRMTAETAREISRQTGASMP